MQAFTVATKHTQKAYFEKTLYMYAALPDELFTRYGALCQRNGQRNVKTWLAKPSARKHYGNAQANGCKETHAR